MSDESRRSGRPVLRRLPSRGLLVSVRSGVAIGLVLVAAVVAVTSAAASSTGTVPPYSGNPTGVTLGMLGDSITNQSRTALHQALNPTYRSSIEAYGGATIASQTSGGTIAAMAAKDPAVMVFDLGTNDLVQVVLNPKTFPLSAFEAEYAAMRAEFTGCVVVTTINTHRDTQGDLATVPDGNAIYDNLAREFDGWLRTHYARVADWDALTTSWKSAGTWSTYMQGDTIHPTAAGQAALAEIVRAQADRCYPSRVVTDTTTTTTVNDAASNATWSGAEVTGAGAYDTATVSGPGSITPTGTATYSFFTNGTCAAPPSATQNVTLNSGAVPNSGTESPLAAGSYSYDAVYSGDINFDASPVSACEPFTVSSATASITSVVDDATSNAPWSGSEVTGASAYDTATVAGNVGVAPTGTVTYSFYANGSCSAPPSTTQNVTLNNGAVPNSGTAGPLDAGGYSFDAVYNGDGNYNASPVSACEAFTVAD
jgi:GDSL-like Lipase/Acylhydrolase family